MQLLTFAHKNEAAAFFHHRAFEADKNFHNLYRNESHYLLITGEGLWESFSKLMLCLSFLQSQNIKILDIINFGVAGALRTGLNKYDVYAVRTAYASLRETDPEYHSYTSVAKQSSLKMLDTLSYFKRATDPTEKLRLSPFAALVDREVWAIARAATLHNLPWQSIKVISDTLDEGNNCDLILNQAHEFSDKLYLAWNSDTSDTDISETEIAEQNILQDLKNFSFVFTFTQRHLVLDLIKKIQTQENILLTDLINQAPLDLWKTAKPKDKSQQLIQWLRLRLTPQLSQYASKIHSWISHWKTQQVDLQMNAASEFEYLEIKFKSYNNKDWLEAMEHLKNIPRHELELILQGKF